MRMLAKDGIKPRAVPFRTVEGLPLVRLRLGVIWFAMETAEATQLATDIVDAVDSLHGHSRGEDEKP
jgi:hypothetical protein